MNQRVKNILLILGFFLVLFISYKLAIFNTLLLRKEYKALKHQKALFDNSPKQLSILKQKQQYYNSLLVTYKLDGSSIQNNLLKTINRFSEAHDLKVIRFLEPHISSANNLTIKTYEFTVEGNFNNILKLIHQLEQKTSFGEIINLHFEKKKNHRTRKSYLHTRVLLKSFE